MEELFTGGFIRLIVGIGVAVLSALTAILWRLSTRIEKIDTRLSALVEVQNIILYALLPEDTRREVLQKVGQVVTR